MSARFAAESAATAISIERGATAAFAPPPEGARGSSRSMRSASAIAAASAPAVFACTATSRSLGPASRLSFSRPASRSNPRLAGEAMITETCSTPASLPSALESCMSDTESR